MALDGECLAAISQCHPRVVDQLAGTPNLACRAPIDYEGWQGGGTSMKEQVAEIVAAYLQKNTIATNDLPALITTVYRSLAALKQPQDAELEPTLKPAVPIRRSVDDDFVVCLECGRKAKILRRHLKITHNLTPDAYRQRWNLPAGHPIVARNYTASRSELAKALGLGQARGRPPNPAPLEMPKE